jgi:hypothetical protein
VLYDVCRIVRRSAIANAESIDPGLTNVPNQLDALPAGEMVFGEPTSREHPHD